MSLPIDISDLMSFAHQLAEAAARETLPLFRNLTSVDNKLADGFDPVTKADRNSERAMRDLIEAHYPDHAILGEEFDEKTGDDFQWVLDPIDGTRAFMSGMASWGTLIGLNHKATPVLGMMDQPYIGERFFAYMENGKMSGTMRPNAQGGAERPLQTRPCGSLEEAVVATTTPVYFDTGQAREFWHHVSNNAKLARYGGDCYNYALLAIGEVDVVIEKDLKIFDIQPLVPLIEAAGGVVTDWQGGPAHIGGTALACGDRHLHTALLASLARLARLKD